MNPTVNKQQLLETLRKNRERHIEIVKEAKAGYVAKAIGVLQAKMERLQRGHLEKLEFDLAPPRDCTDQYDSAIAMLEWNKAEEIELTEAEFQTYVLDKWRWQHDFLFSNSAYSATAGASLR